MAEDDNGDVDRAMAAIAASPMRYFTNGSSTPGGPVRSEIAGGYQVNSVPAAAFPLLLAALPELNQASMPAPPTAPDGVSNKLRTAAADIRKAELQTRRAKALYRPVPQPPEMSSSRHTERAPNISASFGFGVRTTSATQTASHPAPGTSNARSTPIATLFHALHTLTPSQEDPAEIRAGLPDVFRRL